MQERSLRSETLLHRLTHRQISLYSFTRDTPIHARPTLYFSFPLFYPPPSPPLLVFFHEQSSELSQWNNEQHFFFFLLLLLRNISRYGITYRIAVECIFNLESGPEMNEFLAALLGDRDRWRKRGGG